MDDDCTIVVLYLGYGFYSVESQLKLSRGHAAERRRR